MGDSITAAFSARSDIMEARDISWSVGIGYEDQLTLPWLLGQYSAHSSPPIAVQGMSTTKILPIPIDMPHYDYHPKTDRMNVAQSEGSVGANSLEEQWALLLDRFTEYDTPDANFKDGWKVLTVWMTANDVCGACNGLKDLTDWTDRTNQLLYNVSSTLTNVYVNLISTLNLSDVARIQREHVGCAIEHKILNECGCIDQGLSTPLNIFH